MVVASPIDYSKLAPALRDEVDAVLKCFIPHPMLLDAHRLVRHALAMPQGYGIVLVVGPPGVGKSALASACRVVDPTKPNSALGLPISEGSVPVISVTANSGNSFLSRWKSILIDVLRATSPVYKDPTLDHMKIPQLESAAIKAMRHRKTVALLIDEAQDLAPVDSVSDMEMLSRGLKHLGSAQQTVLVLFGGYSLLRFLGSSVSDAGESTLHVSRRCQIVHFPGYDMRKPTDRATFQRIVSTFCSVAPTLLPYSALADHIPQLYVGSGGGTGNLRLWFLRALGLAVAQSTPVVSWEHISATRMLTPTMKGLLGSLDSGQKLVDTLYAGFDEVVSQVFGELPAAPPVPALPAVTGRARPGKRSPSRDPLTPQPV